MPHSPVIPVAERAISSGDPDELIALLTGQVRIAVLERFHALMELQQRATSEGGEAQQAFETAARRLEAWARSVASLASGEAEEEQGG